MGRSNLKGSTNMSNKLKIVVFGMGYVGLTSSACALKQGHSIVGIDVSREKVRALKEGKSPIYEPGLAELLFEGFSEGKLTAQEDPGTALQDADLAIVCVGTPSLPEGAHNMSYIASVSQEIARALRDHGRTVNAPLTVAYRSTVRPGTMEELVWPILIQVLGDAAKDLVTLAYNPEFLRESTAIQDYFEPPKIVVGTADGQPNAVLDKLYETIEAIRFNVGFREAEVTKFVDNSFHAVKVTFANEIGRICHRLGISAAQVHEIFVSDRKLNVSPYYLRPGGAFGGSCLPKDVRALSHISTDVGASTHLIDSLIRSNADHRRFLFEEATRDLPPGARLLLNGLAFKANSDDLRESPLVEIAEMCRRQGYVLKIYDPHVNPETLIGTNLGYQLANIPALNTLLVSLEDLDGAEFDLVIDGRGNADELPVRSKKIYRADTMA